MTQVLCDFGKLHIDSLDSNCSESEMLSCLEFLKKIWNASVVDSWNGNDYREKATYIEFYGLDDEFNAAKELFNRKRNLFALDKRAIGNITVRKESEGFIIRCEIIRESAVKKNKTNISKPFG